MLRVMAGKHGWGLCWATLGHVPSLRDSDAFHTLPRTSSWAELSRPAWRDGSVVADGTPRAWALWETAGMCCPCGTRCQLCTPPSVETLGYGMPRLRRCPGGPPLSSKPVAPSVRTADPSSG